MTLKLQLNCLIVVEENQICRQNLKLVRSMRNIRIVTCNLRFHRFLVMQIHCIVKPYFFTYTVVSTILLGNLKLGTVGADDRFVNVIKVS